jgi:hypothetical protein
MQADHHYSACYCEENIWHLAQSDQLPDSERTVVFIAAESGACPLWEQRAVPAEREPVFWDYHVILLLHERDAGYRWQNACVFDLDSTAGWGLSLTEYLAATFPMAGQLRDEYEPRFRLIPAEDYVRDFASDRSHMRGDDGSWLAPPPEWPLIGEGHNLPDYISTTDAPPGRVVTLAELMQLQHPISNKE